MTSLSGEILILEYNSDGLEGPLLGNQSQVFTTGFSYSSIYHPFCKIKSIVYITTTSNMLWLYHNNRK